MGTFSRVLDGELINQLKRTELFGKLKIDIEKGEIFPAIRNDTIQFYYKGCRMFIFDRNGFRTHYKYLIDNSKSGSKYITNDGVEKIDGNNFIVSDFYSGYESIKQNLSVYAKPEATLTSGFYKKSFFKKDVKDNYYLFDIEAAFAKQDEQLFDCDEQVDAKRRGTDRVDAVFFDKSNGTIIFCEVKRYDDSRIYPNVKKGGSIEVVEQLGRYKEQIAKRHDEIIAAYNNAMKVYHELFGCDTFEVKNIYSQAWLFITGCPQELYKMAEPSVKQIEADGYKVHFREEASGEPLVYMCKNSH